MKIILALQTWHGSQMQEHIIFRWFSLKSTIEYLGEWEILYNPDFNCTEVGTIKNAAGSNNFVLSVKTWIERTKAIGLLRLVSIISFHWKLSKRKRVLFMLMKLTC